MVESDRSDYFLGIAASALGHVVLVCLLFVGIGQSRTLLEPTIYSVTVEGGKSIGGIGQVPKPDAPKTAAPPKKVSAPAPAKKEESKVKPVEKKPESKEKAEVSLAEKKKLEKEKKEAEKKAKSQKDNSQENLDKRLEAAMQRYLGESSDAGGKGFGAARLGGSGMGGGALLPAEALVYRDLLKNRIKSGWRWYDTSAALTTGVTFEISNSGEISNVEIISGSGNREYDDSVLRAIYKASPVPAPPEKVYEYFKKVRMVFDPRE